MHSFTSVVYRDAIYLLGEAGPGGNFLERSEISSRVVATQMHNLWILHSGLCILVCAHSLQNTSLAGTKRT